MEGSLNFSNSSDAVSRCITKKLVTGFSLWVLIYALCLPIFLMVFYLGFKKWKKRLSGNFSHSDVFTFNIVFMEMCGLLGSITLTSGLHLGLFSSQGRAGASLMCMNSFGQCFFQCLTCIDRYLAVVFPVTYLRLRKGRGVTIRNATIGSVWLLCIGRIVFVHMMNYFDEPVSGFILVIFALVVVTFCCISVLCVLIRPKPGATVVDNQRIDQSKRRAFDTMAVILGALLIKFVSDTSYYILNFMADALRINKCILFLVVLWCSLPNSLVLPLLFLHRAGTLKICKSSVSATLPSSAH